MKNGFKKLKNKLEQEEYDKKVNARFTKMFEHFDEYFSEFMEEKEVEEKEKEKLYLSFENIQKTIDNLPTYELKQYDTILCVTRGGLIPAGMLAYKLGIKTIVNIQVSSYNGEKQGEMKLTPLSKKEIKILKNSSKILIVDDIVDTGNTIEAIDKYLKPFHLETDVFSIVTKMIDLNNYTLLDMTNDSRWVVFPWDKQ